jgi:hypothetical protein
MKEEEEKTNNRAAPALLIKAIKAGRATRLR